MVSSSRVTSSDGWPTLSEPDSSGYTIESPTQQHPEGRNSLAYMSSIADTANRTWAIRWRDGNLGPGSGTLLWGASAALQTPKAALVFQTSIEGPRQQFFARARLLEAVSSSPSSALKGDDVPQEARGATRWFAESGLISPQSQTTPQNYVQFLPRVGGPLPGSRRSTSPRTSA